jgi:hypothetical protein
MAAGLEDMMKYFGFLRVIGVAAGFFALPALGLAQPNASPQQLQAMIADGQGQAALNQLQGVLQAHPDSGVAWYLTAEAQDVLGHEDAARSALAKAEQISSGLPFAKADEVSALKAHLQNSGGGAIAGHGGMGSMIFVLGGLVVLFFVVRIFLRGRRQVMPGDNAYGRPMAPGPGWYGPGYAPPGYGGGSGIGGSLIGGLAAGAGFAAGERIIDDMEGNRGQGYVDPNIGGAGPAPNRDDGLQGNPGWDDNSGGNDSGGFDPNNSW